MFFTTDFWRRGRGRFELAHCIGANCGLVGHRQHRAVGIHQQRSGSRLLRHIQRRIAFGGKQYLDVIYHIFDWLGLCLKYMFEYFVDYHLELMEHESGERCPWQVHAAQLREHWPGTNVQRSGHDSEWPRNSYRIRYIGRKLLIKKNTVFS